MVENIYTKLKEKSKVHPGLPHIGNLRDKDSSKNLKSEYIDEIQRNLQTLCNIHQNQSAVVFGAGPSLLSYKEIDDGSFIRVSCNRQIFREEILPFHLYINVDGGSGGGNTAVVAADTEDPSLINQGNWQAANTIDSFLRRENMLNRGGLATDLTKTQRGRLETANLS